MDGARKTAILLLSLDPSVAADVLRKLPREQVERVTLAIANAESVTREEQESILNEFKTTFASRPLIQPVGPETARELLERSLDQTEVEPMQDRIDEQVQAGPFAYLHNRHADEVRRLIENEHPQTIAVVSAQLPPGLAAQVLAGLAADAQADVLARLARLGPTDMTILEEIAGLLKVRLGPISVRIGGVSRAANVLRETTRPISRSVLRTIDLQDASLAGTLRENLFSFQEIESLDDETLRVVLQGTDNCQWAVALKGASENMRQRVLTTLAVQIAQVLKNEINSLGPTRLSEISAAQAQIIEGILILESEYQIELPKKNRRPVLI